MSYRVRIENFEGPFDLLLYLVSRQKVDIGSVNITQIADQYLDEIAHMENLDLDVASDFLLVASTLLKIKAESLVNNDARELDEDVAELAPNEARDMLVDKLLVYKQFKSAAAALESRFEAESRMHPRMAPLEEQFANLTADYLDNATIEQLAVIASGLFGRRRLALLESEHIASKPIPVETYVGDIQAKLARKRTMRFSELVTRETPTPVVVVTFLAILEMYKRVMVNVVQDEEFGDIRIEAIEDKGGPAKPQEEGE